MENNNRKSNLELLKVVAIIMILILHYLNGGIGGALNKTTNATNNYYIIRYIESFCIIAVNCFVLITGYFMINKKSVKANKAINLIIISIFYSLIFYIMSILLKINVFSFNGLQTSLMVMYSPKWFIVAYIGLYLLIPYLNKIILGMNITQYKKFLLIIIIIFSIVPTLFPKVCYNDGGYGIINFVLLYFIGGYLRLHHKPLKSKIYYLAIYILCTLFTSILVIGNVWEYKWWNYNTIFNIVSSISLFLLFLKLEFNSRIVNSLATFSLPIYIIHTDVSIRTFIYRTVFKCDKYWNSPDLLINMIKTVVGLFIGCIVIDMARRVLVRLLDKKIKLQNEIEISI